MTTRPHPGREVTAERSALVDRTRQAWSRKLIDLSRRNNLLFFRNLKRGTLELTEAEPPALAALLRGENVQVRRLLPRETWLA